MSGLSLREAAQQAGTSKSTILRAIQGGRLSAPRTDDGGYDIDPAELFRVYPPRKSSDELSDRPGDHRGGRDSPVRDLQEAVEIRVRNARLEGELKVLTSALDAEKRRCDELRYDRDRWAAQAERLALTGPVSTPVAPPAVPQAQANGFASRFASLFRGR
jgi:excisionase family DNA binding protein